jgi:prepilin-type N-terminal cleavage/methylation domain-containing protein
MCQNKRWKPVKRAFTFVEMMVVLVILAIAAAIVVPMASSASTMQLRAAVDMVSADLEYAKSMAVSRGQMYSVVFDTAAESYQIEDPNGNVIPHPVKKGSNYVVNFRTDGRLGQVNIVSASFNGGNRVKFDYLGSPFDGADPANALNSGVVTLQVGKVTRTVRVEPVTGYITISD